MLSETDSKIQNSPIQWKWRHAKSHQYKYFGPLDRWASLNVECNHSPKRRWYQEQENSQIPNPLHNLRNKFWIIYSDATTYP